MDNMKICTGSLVDPIWNTGYDWTVPVTCAYNNDYIGLYYDHFLQFQPLATYLKAPVNQYFGSKWDGKRNHYAAKCF